MAINRTTDDQGCLPYSAFGYLSILDDNNEFIKENIFINALNVLSYIPGVSMISGLARIIFASFDETAEIDHFHHIRRGFLDMIPIVGNITCLVLDAMEIIHECAIAGSEWIHFGQRNFSWFSGESL
jgi:hypothetical protein